MQSNSVRKGGRGDPPERDRGDVVSLAERFRRDLQNSSQLEIFPERKAYETYLTYCRMLKHPYPPMDFDTWKAESHRIFGASLKNYNSLTFE